jgi:hypothetical protein
MFTKTNLFQAQAAQAAQTQFKNIMKKLFFLSTLFLLPLFSYSQDNENNENNTFVDRLLDYVEYLHKTRPDSYYIDENNVFRHTYECYDSLGVIYTYTVYYKVNGVNDIHFIKQEGDSVLSDEEHIKIINEQNSYEYRELNDQLYKILFRTRIYNIFAFIDLK